MKLDLIRLRRLVILIALLAVITSAINVVAETKGTTEVIVIGGLHSMHSQSKKYSPEILRDVIVSIKPDAILSELPATALGKPTIINNRINPMLVPDASDENWSTNAAADILNIPVIAYDRADRNEHFAKTKYFERMGALAERTESWCSNAKYKEISPITAACLCPVADLAQDSQIYFSLNAGPELINSKGFDDIIRIKHKMSDELMPILAAQTASLADHAGEFTFLRDEWNDRNRIMVDNIIEQARKFSGGRLVIICGIDHKYALRDLLSAVPGLKVFEYYEAVSK